MASVAQSVFPASFWTLKLLAPRYAAPTLASDGGRQRRRRLGGCLWGRMCILATPTQFVGVTDYVGAREHNFARRSNFDAKLVDLGDVGKLFDGIDKF